MQADRSRSSQVFILCLWEKAKLFTVRAWFAPIARARIFGLLAANIGIFNA